MAQRKRKRSSVSALLRNLLIALLALAVTVLVAVLIYWRFFGTSSDAPQIALNIYDAEAFYEEDGLLRYRAMEHMVGIDVS